MNKLEKMNNTQKVSELIKDICKVNRDHIESLLNMCLRY